MSNRGSKTPAIGRPGTSSQRQTPSGRTTATSSISRPGTSVTRVQTQTVRTTESGSRLVNSQSRATESTITKVPGTARARDPGATKIRMTAATASLPKKTQTTTVKVTGTGLKPTGSRSAANVKATATGPKPTSSKSSAAKKTCEGPCRQPALAPFTEEVARGRPVPTGMYYMPITGVPDRGLGSPEKKLRQKLQKYTPTMLQHWKVESKDPFAKKHAPLQQQHPDIISGVFRSARGEYVPEEFNPYMEQTFDPSMPPEEWSLALREAMSLQSGVYEEEDDEGVPEPVTMEYATIEREFEAQMKPSEAAPQVIAKGTCSCRDYLQSESPRESFPCQTSPPALSERSGLSPAGQVVPYQAMATSPERETTSIQQIQTPLLPTQRPTDILPTIQHPEYYTHTDVHMGSPVKMQSPVGEIQAQNAIYMQRELQTSPLGTRVDTAIRASKLVSPGQTKEIDIVKKDLYPAPSGSQAITSPARSRSPPVQYISPSDQRQPPGFQAPSPRQRMSPEQAVICPPGFQAARSSPPGYPVSGYLEATSQGRSPQIRDYPHSESPEFPRKTSPPALPERSGLSPVAQVEPYQAMATSPERDTTSIPQRQIPRMPTQRRTDIQTIQPPEYYTHTDVQIGSPVKIPSPKVKATAKGLKPPSAKSSATKKTCEGPCRQPAPAPFTEEDERGRPVPTGMYYKPIMGVPDRGLGSPEKKLRQKLQKHMPTSIQRWKVESKDPFARKHAPLQEQHPDIISGVFRSARGEYVPEEFYPYMEQTFDPSMPPEEWSLALREAMSLQSGVYEEEDDEGVPEPVTMEYATIEREFEAQMIPSEAAPQEIAKGTCSCRDYLQSESSGESFPCQTSPPALPERSGLSPAGQVVPYQAMATSPKRDTTSIPQRQIPQIPTQRRADVLQTIQPPEYYTHTDVQMGSPVKIPSPKVKATAKGLKPPSAKSSAAKGKATAKGLKPTSSKSSAAKKKCEGPCRQPAPAPFTEEDARGRPVPPGMYYMPIMGVPERGLGSPEKKLRQKLQKYTPTILQHWKVEPKDPFAKKHAPLQQQHPDIISGVFRSARGEYVPEEYIPYMEQTFDPSMPPEEWSLALREAMSLQSGVYEEEDDEGVPEPVTMEYATIEREFEAQMKPSGVAPQEIAKATCSCRDYLQSESPGGSLPHRTSPPALPERSRLSPAGQVVPYQAMATSPKRETTSIQQIQTPLLPAQRPTDILPTIQHPEYYTHTDVHMGSPVKMQSPVGEIQAQNAIYMQRELQTSPLGTRVDTAIRASKLVSPGQTKEIDIVKKDLYPAPSGSQAITSPARSRSPPVQYISPSDQRQPPGFQAPSPRQRMSPEQAAICCPPGFQAERSPPSYQDSGELEETSQRRSPQIRGTVPTPPRIPQIQIPSPERALPADSPVATSSRFLKVIPDTVTSEVRPPMRTLELLPSETPTSSMSPIRLDTPYQVPLNSADATVDIVRRLIAEESQDVVVSQELPPQIQKKLNKLKKKPQSTRLLEETIDHNVLGEDEDEQIRPDMVAELMREQETHIIDPTTLPKKKHDEQISEEKQISVSPAGPAPLHDIVVPVGEADIDSVAIVNKEITDAAAAGTDEIPQANAYAEAVAKEDGITSPSQEPKPTERKEAEEEEAAHLAPKGELELQKAPWDIDIGSLEDLVGGQLSIGSGEKLPSDESIRATVRRFEYVLDVQKPTHYSCVQLRGSQLPTWFPGYYSVLPQVDGFVQLEKSPSRAYAAAWNVLSPISANEQSEVVIL